MRFRPTCKAYLGGGFFWLAVSFGNKDGVHHRGVVVYAKDGHAAGTRPKGAELGE